MAYRKQKQRMLGSGSLTLVPPSDKLRDPDALELQNWRVDQAGQLQSRKGYGEVRTLGVGQVHTLLRFNEHRFAGAGTGLYKGTAVESFLQDGFDGSKLGLVAYQNNLWVMNPAKRGRNNLSDFGSWYNWGIAAPSGAPSVSAGGSETVAVAEFDAGEDWVVQGWVGGTAKTDSTYESEITTQGRVNVENGSTDIVGVGTSWDSTMDGKNIHIITGTGSDVYTVIASVTDETHLSIITPFDMATDTGLEYVISETLDRKSFDTGNKISGGASLSIAATPAGTWQARRELLQNLFIDGTDKRGDVFEFWFYAEDPKSIDSLTVTFEGTDADGLPRRVFCNVPTSVLNQQLYSWNQIQIRRGIDAESVVFANPDYQALLAQHKMAAEMEDFVATKTLEDQISAMFETLVNQSLSFQEQYRVAGSTASRIRWNAVTALSFDVKVNSPIFIHFDKATFTGGVGGTLAGDFNYWVTFANSEGHESNPSPASDTVSLNRQSASVSVPASPDAQVTRRHIYRTGGGVSQVLRVGTVEGNASATYADRLTIADQQLLGIAMQEDNDLPPAASGCVGPYEGRLIAWSGNRLYWSKTAQPWAWPAFNFRDVGADGEKILAVTMHRGSLWIYKERTNWRIDGDPDKTGVEPRQTNANRAVVGDKAVVTAGGIDYFAASDGVFSFNGDYEEDLSARIRPLFLGETTEVSSGVNILPWNEDAASTVTLGFAEGKLFVSYPESGSSTPSKTAVLHVDSKVWAQYTGGFSAFGNEGQKMLGGTPSGAVVLVEDGFTDQGSTIAVRWQSGFYDMGIPDNAKMCADLVVVHNTGNAALQVDFLRDNSTPESAGTIQSGNRAISRFPLGPAGEGREVLNAAVRITGSLTSAPARIFDVFLHWYPLERRAMTFDTGVVDLGTEKVKQVNLLEAEITPFALSSHKTYTDLPGAGGSLAVRSTASILVVSSGQRQVTQIPLSVEGRRVRWTLAGSGDGFILHRLRARYRAVGEYFDGSVGGAWESQPMRLADLASLKDAVIQYQAESGGTLRVYTDRPGGTMAERASYAIAAASTWTTLTIPFDAAALEASLVKFRVESAGVFRLFDGQFRFRPVGTWIKAGQFWQSEPVFLGAVNQIYKLELVMANTGSVDVALYTELPEKSVLPRYAVTVAAGSRRPVEIRLPGSTRGELVAVKLTPASGAEVSLYEVRVWAKPLGEESAWRWIDLPVIKTPLEWQTQRLPIEPTAEAFTWVDIPVDVIE